MIGEVKIISYILYLPGQQPSLEEYCIWSGTSLRTQTAPHGRTEKKMCFLIRQYCDLSHGIVHHATPFAKKITLLPTLHRILFNFCHTHVLATICTVNQSAPFKYLEIYLCNDNKCNSNKKPDGSTHFFLFFWCELKFLHKGEVRFWSLQSSITPLPAVLCVECQLEI